MRGPHDPKVAIVEGGDSSHTEPFGDRHDGRVDKAEGEVLVSASELSDSDDIHQFEFHHLESVVYEAVQEVGFRSSSQLSSQVAARFGQDRRDDDGTVIGEKDVRRTPRDASHGR